MNAQTPIAVTPSETALHEAQRSYCAEVRGNRFGVSQPALDADLERLESAGRRAADFVIDFARVPRRTCFVDSRPDPVELLEVMLDSLEAAFDGPAIEVVRAAARAQFDRVSS